MNTYAIAVLVIFYLQLKHGLPTVTELPLVFYNKTKFSSENKLGDFVKEFFEFYGKTFESKSHIISINVGKWQQKVQEDQKHFTPEQKRFVIKPSNSRSIDIKASHLTGYHCMASIFGSVLLKVIYINNSSLSIRRMRDGIAVCPNNWQNCIMWVQDIVSPHINITAEISNQEIDSFVRMCRIFSEYVPTLYDDNEYLDGLSMLDPLQDANLLNLIENGISNSKSPEVLEQRRRAELEIVSTLTKYIREFDSSFTVYPFGSTRYGIRRANANFNLLIITSKF